MGLTVGWGVFAFALLNRDIINRDIAFDPGASDPLHHHLKNKRMQLMQFVTGPLQSNIWILSAARCHQYLHSAAVRWCAPYLKGCSRVDVDPSLPPVVSLVTGQTPD